MSKEKFKAIRSPISWQGSKGRFAEVITKNLPDKSEVTSAIDIFCGSGEVGIGMFDYDKVVCNDLGDQVIGIHRMLQKQAESPEPSQTYVDHLKLIESSYGLGKFDKNELVSLKKSFEDLKKTYNTTKSDYELLYLIHCNSFSNSLRYDSTGKVNIPYGQRYMNPSLQKKMLQWLDILKNKDVTFTSSDFRKVDLTGFDFAFFDCPYLLSDTTYQATKKTGWGIKEEYALYSKIDKFCNTGGKIMLTNQLFSNGKENYLLREWVESRTDLVVRYLDTGSYTNCNYQRSEGKTVEILVTNY